MGVGVTNEEIDQKIIEALDGRTLKFGQIFYNIPHDISEHHVIYRQLDRRLQALRKKGKIKFSHGFGWRMA